VQDFCFQKERPYNISMARSFSGECPKQFAFAGCKVHARFPIKLSATLLASLAEYDSPFNGAFATKWSFLDRTRSQQLRVCLVQSHSCTPLYLLDFDGVFAKFTVYNSRAMFSRQLQIAANWWHRSRWFLIIIARILWMKNGTTAFAIPST